MPKVRIIKTPNKAKSGGSLSPAINGLSIEGNQYTPLSNETLQIGGKKHSEGGTDLSYFGNKVEAEQGETVSIDKDGAAVIYGNMLNPLTKRKFKEDSKILADKEQKVNKLMKKATGLVQYNDPMDKWEQLSFNSGTAMMSGASRKKGELATNKEWLATLQKAMLDRADEMGADPQEFSKGNLKAKNGLKIASRSAQAGDKLQGINEDAKAAYLRMLAEAPDFVKKGLGVGSGFRSPEQQKLLYEQGLKKYGAKNVSKYVATPGNSAHEYGLAVDNKFIDPKAKEWMYANAKSYGFDFPLKDSDPNHMVYTQNLPNNRWEGPKSLGIGIGGRSPKFGSEDIRTYKTPFTPSTLPPNLTYNETPYSPNKVTPNDYDLTIDQPRQFTPPDMLQPLRAEQYIPELYAAATNKEEPVWLQQYNPQLFQPYQMSFQDRLNANNSTFRGMTKSLSNSPASLASLAAQKYQADSQVLADEFRTNQAISQDVVNKNVNLLNDAQLKNLALADQQYVRQSQAKSNTKAVNQEVLNSISSKLLQHNYENLTQGVYQNLYDYRFDNNNGRAHYYGAPGQEFINWEGAGEDKSTNNTRKQVTLDKDNQVKQTRYTTPGNLDTQLKLQKYNQTDFENMNKLLKRKSLPNFGKYKGIGLNY